MAKFVEGYAINKLIEHITDEKSFVEMLTRVHSKSSLGEAVGEGVVSGFATINDIQVGLFATNSEVLCGSIGKKTAKKISKCIEDAIATHSPVIGIIDTAGARFAEGIKAMEGYGTILRDMNKAYGVVPTVCVVLGKSYGMATYLTTCCDVCIAYDKASIATSSPLILAAKAKEDVAKVGTADVHAKSGLISKIVKSDEELRDELIKVLELFVEPEIESHDDANRVCTDLVAGAKAKDIINSAFDRDTFVEIKADYAQEVVTGFARLNGIAVGVVANNAAIDDGKLTANGANKISSLLATCSNFGMPIVNIVACGGVVNDLASENDNLIREIGDMVYCYNMIGSAKISLIVGKAIGLGYVAFASKRTFDYSIAWENANIGMLDSIATASLIYDEEIAKADDKEQAAREFAESYAEENTTAEVVAESGYLDNVIQPELTRQYLIAAVQMFGHKE